SQPRSAASRCRATGSISRRCPRLIGPSYMRVFPHDGMTYALAMPGQFFRSKDGLHGFEPGPMLFNPNMRHSAVLKRGNELLVFWTQVGEAPDRILWSRVGLGGDRAGWKRVGPSTWC